MVATQPRTEIRPQRGPQEAFLASPADIVIYGGAAGGGKSYALLLEPLRHMHVPGFGAVVFRRTSPQVRNEGGLWDTSLGIYPHLRATPKESILEWDFPPHHNRVKFAHLEHEKNILDWQGSQIPLIEFDELTHFTEKQFWYMLSRNRSTCGVRPYVRASTNPDPDSWVRRLIDWWIAEDGYPIPERAGRLRYFARAGNDLLWGSTPHEVEALAPGSIPKSLTFIPSLLEDNAILMQQDPQYRANLLALSRVDRLRLAEGNWNARDAAGEFFRREWFGPPLERIPNDVTRWVRYWDRAATEPSSATPDPDWTAGVLMGKRADGSLVIADIARDRATPAGVEALIARVTKQDTRDLPEYWGYQQTDPGQAGKVERRALSTALAGLPVRFDPVPRTAKEARVKPLSAATENGLVRLVRGDWNEAFLLEAESFPQGAHDDQVDAAAGAAALLTQPVVARRPHRTTATARAS